MAANWSPEVVNALSAAATRIRPSASAWRLWQRLSAAERLQLGDDYDAAYWELGTIGIWTRARGGTPISAIVGAAREIGFLTSADGEWLLRETAGAARPEPAGSAGEPTTGRGTSPRGAPSRVNRTPNSEKPVWQDGVLSWQNRELADFRRKRNPSLLEQILNAFDDASWATRIANPFADRAREKMSQAIYYLNEKLTPLRLHLEGRFLSWEIDEK